jgi:putative membrane protein
MDWLAPFYPWVKALHIISVISWMAGMLYLPRLFIYHCGADIGSDKSETFKIMERRLLRAIMNPAMIASFLFGGALLATPGVIDWASWWIYVKLILFLVLSGMHGLFSNWRKNFEADQNTLSTKVFRIANEVPTVLMIGIVFLVVVKPGT